MQGGLLIAKSGRLELGDDILGHYRLFQPRWRNWPTKLSNSVGKKQNKSYYAVQCHSRSSRSVSVKSPYASSY